MYRPILFFFFFFFAINFLSAQIAITSEDIDIDYTNPKQFEIGGVTTTGVEYLDNNVLVRLAGLTVGDTIKVPGEKFSKAIQNLWNQGLFSEIKIEVTKIAGNKIFLNIDLKEKPRMQKFSFAGVKRAEADNLRDKIKLSKGDVVSDNLIINTSNIIKNYFVDKGFLNCEVNISQIQDPVNARSVELKITIKKGKKVKIHQINIEGNQFLSDGKIRRKMKETKQQTWYNVFKTSKFLDDEYKNDKIKVIEKYNTLGYRDAKIVKDSVYKFDDRSINIDITIEEGKKYFFRNINWIGNTKHTNEELSSILRIKRGSVYNQELLESNLYMSKDGRDITALYMDDGYLFFSVTPVEVAVENDSIDLELRIYEGKQATINKVTVVGNTKTNDHVVMREIRTKPGQLFNRSDIMRSQRELSQLRFFNAEKMNVNPKPNPANGTVDLEYLVEETSSDQVELSGGWGGGRVVGTIGVTFNNFSVRNIFNKNAWKPLPSGDGQQFSVRAQSNGLYYQSINASFTEPWLGGKRPNSFSTSVYYSVQSNGLKLSDTLRESIVIKGITFGLGKRLAWPDDYFTLYNELSFQNYHLNNFNSTFTFNNGYSNNFSYSVVFGRNSIDAPIYPRSGSSISLKVTLTPPYSLFRKVDYDTLTQQERFKWVEYHKWKFSASWYTKLIENLVLNTRMQYGFLGMYNSNVGLAPFERFYVGGDGLTGYALDGREIIALRGYSNNSLTPRTSMGMVGGAIYDKYTMEVRYPISLNPMATIYVLGFAEAGNSWMGFKEFNPFQIKKSAGAGVRLFLPMFGQLGLDWGYGFDEVPGLSGANKSQFHFSIGQSIE